MNFKFDILSSHWEITEVPSNDSSLIYDGDRCNGVAYFDSHKIYINKDIPPDEKRSTVIHEIVHAVLYSTQIGGKKKYTEENLCDFIGRYGDLIHSTTDSYFKQQFRNKKS